MTTNRQSTPRPRAASGMPRLLTLRDVIAATALSRSAVYAMMAESRFPKPIRIGSRAVRWVEQECSTSSPAVPVAAPNAPPRSSDGPGTRYRKRRPNDRDR